MKRYIIGIIAVTLFMFATSPATAKFVTGGHSAAASDTSKKVAAQQVKMISPEPPRVHHLRQAIVPKDFNPGQKKKVIDSTLAKKSGN
jgi:hypothetical protein